MPSRESSNLTFVCDLCGERFEDRIDHINTSTAHLRIENERMREALTPFATAHDVAIRALGHHMDKGHVDAVAKKYIDLDDFAAARALVDPQEKP